MFFYINIVVFQKYLICFIDATYFAVFCWYKIIYIKQIPYVTWSRGVTSLLKWPRKICGERAALWAVKAADWHFENDINVGIVFLKTSCFSITEKGPVCEEVCEKGLHR